MMFSIFPDVVIGGVTVTLRYNYCIGLTLCKCEAGETMDDDDAVVFFRLLIFSFKNVLFVL